METTGAATGLDSGAMRDLTVLELAFRKVGDSATTEAGSLATVATLGVLIGGKTIVGADCAAVAATGASAGAS